MRPPASKLCCLIHLPSSPRARNHRLTTPGGPLPTHLPLLERGSRLTHPRRPPPHPQPHRAAPAMSSAVALLAQGIAVAQGGGTATVVQLPAEQQQQQQQQQPPAQQHQQQQQASTSTVAGACCPLLQTRARPGCARCAARLPGLHDAYAPAHCLPVVQSTWCCGWCPRRRRRARWVGWRPLAATLAAASPRRSLDSTQRGVGAQLPACLPSFVQGVRWAEDVVDNEHMNKKKSKSELGSRVAAAGNHGGGAARSPARVHVPCRLPCCVASPLTRPARPHYAQSAASSTGNVSLASGAMTRTAMQSAMSAGRAAASRPSSRRHHRRRDRMCSACCSM